MGRLSRVDWTETSWCWVVFFGDPGRWVELVVCSAQHWCRNPGNESHDGLGSLVVPCYGLSARYFPRLACGTWFLSSFAGLEGGGLKCTRGGARGDRPLSGRRCRFTMSYLLCLLLSAWLRPVRHSWCTVCFEHFVDVSNHLTCLSALDLVVWGMLDGAIRGRCLIVLWGRERCQRTGYTAVMVAVVCMPGCGLGGIWICTLYFGRRYTW